MKKNFVYSILIITLSIVSVFGKQIPRNSESNNKTPNDSQQKFTIKIEQLTNKVNAPALQSFVHAKFHDKESGDNWLLFAGRTNRTNTNNRIDSSLGGLHQAVKYKKGQTSDVADTNTNNDYAYFSFPFESFNKNLYVYNVDSDRVWEVNVQGLLKYIEKRLPKFNLRSPSFINTNALARQYGQELYVAGGYGPKTLNKPKIGDTITYDTKSSFLKINVPCMIKCIKNKNFSCLVLNKNVQYGSDSLITSTGGELIKINDTFYIVGGQHYWEKDSLTTSRSDSVLGFRRFIYLTSVVPFTIHNKTLPFLLRIDVNKDSIITDVSPLDRLNTKYADTSSAFRRRDVVVAPTFIKNTYTNAFVFHGGVFKPDTSKDPGIGPFKAWDDALFIHPTFKNKMGKKYTFSKDTLLYGSHNVYSCANFVGYDNDSNNVHTFLMGGIGDGKPNYWVSGFTHSVTQTIQPLDAPQKIKAFFDEEGFLIEDLPKYYGTESAFIYKTDPRLKFMKNNEEILDFNATLPNARDSIEIGYIYGGIEADIPNPGGYMGGQTRATNKIFKVTLHKNR